MEGNSGAGEPEQLAAALLDKGIALVEQRQPSAAIETFDQVVRSWGDAAEPSLRRVVAVALASKGSALLQLGRSQDAVAAYEEVERRCGDAADIEVRKVVASALVNKGSLLLDEQPAAAIQSFDQAVERYGGSADPELRKMVAFARKQRSRLPGIVQGARQDRTDGVAAATDNPPDDLRPHLLPGEHVLWSGRPDPLRLFNSQDVFMIPFSLVWGGISMSAALGGISLSAASLVVVLMALFGQYLIWGRFVAKSWQRRRTVYAVTDQRILSVRRRSSQMMPLGQLPAMTCTPRSDGSGSILFGSQSGVAGQLADTGMEWMNSRSAPGVLAFRDIPEVATVYQLIYQHAGTAGSWQVHRLGRLRRPVGMAGREHLRAPRCSTDGVRVNPSRGLRPLTVAQVDARAGQPSFSEASSLDSPSEPEGDWSPLACADRLTRTAGTYSAAVVRQQP